MILHLYTNQILFTTDGSDFFVKYDETPAHIIVPNKSCKSPPNQKTTNKIFKKFFEEINFSALSHILNILELQTTGNRKAENFWSQP